MGFLITAPLSKRGNCNGDLRNEKTRIITSRRVEKETKNYKVTARNIRRKIKGETMKRQESTPKNLARKIKFLKIFKKYLLIKRNKDNAIN